MRAGDDHFVRSAWRRGLDGLRTAVEGHAAALGLCDAGDELTTDYSQQFWHDQALLDDVYGVPMERFSSMALPLLLCVPTLVSIVPCIWVLSVVSARSSASSE